MAALPPIGTLAAPSAKIRADGAGRLGRAISRLSQRSISCLRSSLVLRNRLFVPFKTHAVQVGDMQHAVLDFVGPLENRVSPVLPFKPMGALGDARHVGSDLGIEVGGNRHTGRASNSG